MGTSRTAILLPLTNINPFQAANFHLYLRTSPTKYLEFVQVKWFKESVLYIPTLVELGIILQVPSTWLQQTGESLESKVSV